MFPSRRIVTMGGDVFRDEYSLAFDGSNDYVDCGNPSTILDDTLGSISIWVKNTASGGNKIMFSGSADGDASSDLTIAKNTSDELWIFVRNDGGSNLLTFTSTATLVQNAWHHVVFAVGSSSNAIYLDGALAAGTYAQGDNTTQKWFSDVADIDTLLIGARRDSSAVELFWEGNISEVAYYNKQLSASEVATIYNGREPYNHKEGIAVSNLKGWWRMGDGALDEYGSSNGVIGSIIDESVGTELMVDAGFDNASYWDVPSDCTVNNSGDSKAVFTNCANNSRLDPDTNVDAVAGRIYKTVFTISFISEGGLKIHVGGVDGTNRTSAGTYTEYFLATGASYIYLRTNLETSARVDNISIKQLGVNAGLMINMEAVDFSGDTP